MSNEERMYKMNMETSVNRKVIKQAIEKGKEFDY